ncbi:ras guanine nucleotide exchange factor domain-containing protein [Sporodiniella umbellata]|nr:ras guanine nucleotide exchange factor domain-containing protein [Sporodiniella umbellata]
MSTLLCKVKANYAFESNDPSSLNFKEGEIIEVLCKLPSGWWDGWTSGRRGWFPSNYVQTVQDYSLSDKHQLFLDPSTGEMTFRENSPPGYESPALTFQQLMANITLAIQQLVAAATKDSDNSDYVRYATNVVHAVRFMMLATNTVSRETKIVQENDLLRIYHRVLTNALAKLVFSSQSDETSLLLIESQEVLLAVRNFVHLCVTLELELCQVDPVLAPFQYGLVRETDHRQSGMNRDWTALVKSSAECMQSMLTTFITQLNPSTDSRDSLASLLFTQYRHLATLNGQFMSLVESADLYPFLGSLLVKDLSVSKQSLYAGFGMLFIRMQSLNDASMSLQSLAKQMQAIAHCLQQAIQDIGRILIELAQEEAKLSLSSKQTSFALTDSSQFDLNKDFASVHPTELYPDRDYHAKETLADRPDTIYQKPHEVPPLYKKQEEEDDSPAYQKVPTSPRPPPSPVVCRKMSTVTENSQMSDNQSFMSYDYAASDIVFNSSGQVKGGTLPALIERITLHDYFDMGFSNTFFLTYRSFCTSEKFLELLETRFHVQPPTGLLEEELLFWKERKQKLIRLRVLNVIKIWLEQYYDEQDYGILNRVSRFMISIHDTHAFSATQIESLIQKRKDSCKEVRSLVVTQTLEAPEPILPRNLKRLKLLDISPIEMARQLTLIDFKLYSSIQPIECLDKAWSREEDSLAVHIQASIRFCNGMTQWVSDEILSQGDVKKRSLVLKYWVDVAEKCQQSNNFNTCMAILSAFDNSAIGRLKRTWELVGGKTQQIVGQLRDIMKANRNFVRYRELVHSINPPCVPFVGIYLQDLTFIEDGNSNYLKSPYSHLINFAKRSKTAAVIQEIQQYQMTSYQFLPVEPIQEFIVNNMGSSRDEEQLYKESLKLEPK